MTTWQAIGERVEDGELVTCIGCGVPVYVEAWRRHLRPTATAALCGHCQREHRKRKGAGR